MIRKKSRGSKSLRMILFRFLFVCLFISGGALVQFRLQFLCDECQWWWCWYRLNMGDSCMDSGRVSALEGN